MPKVGMEPVRRKALVDAALRVIGDQGTLAVTMSDIARHAGVSPALAHHYFGSKEQLLIETVRSLLRQLRDDTVTALSAAITPRREKLSALIRVSFQAKPVCARHDRRLARLLFRGAALGRRPPVPRRLRPAAALQPDGEPQGALSPSDDAERIAEGAAAMIDGLYIRREFALLRP